MSVAISPSGSDSPPGRCPPGYVAMLGSEEENMDGDLDTWRADVRAKVTALKCHVMASRGLTQDGHIVAPYSPSILLDDKTNRLLLDAGSLDLDDLRTNEGFLALVQTNHTTEHENGKAELGQEVIAPDDIQLDIKPNHNNNTSHKNQNDNSSQGEDDVDCKAPSVPSSPVKSLSKPSSPSKMGVSPSKSQKSTISSQSPAKSNSDFVFLSDTPTKVNGHITNGYSQHNGSLSGSPCKTRRDSCSGLPLTVEQELVLVKEELRNKSEECERLEKIRDEVENELQELTANLFQEAHNMVAEANQRAASAERSLREAAMQVEVLSAEVTALKALVITSTPSAPNAHLHPQLQTKRDNDTGKSIFQRGHRKSPSDFDLKYGRDTTPPSSPHKESRMSQAAAAAATQFPLDPEGWEVDPVVHGEFVSWKAAPSLQRCDSFMSRMYQEDIDLCLAFPNSTLAHQVQRACEDNNISIEEINPKQKNSCPKKCVLLDVPRYCKYRFRLGDADDNWYYISQLARNRIIAVCDFLNYLRYIKLGLVKSSIHDVYWEVVKLRRQMSMARLGF